MILDDVYAFFRFILSQHIFEASLIKKCAFYTLLVLIEHVSINCEPTCSETVYTRHRGGVQRQRRRWQSPIHLYTNFHTVNTLYRGGESVMLFKMHVRSRRGCASHMHLHNLPLYVLQVGIETYMFLYSLQELHFFRRT